MDAHETESSTSSGFFSQPVLNNPYREPSKYWELDADNQPTHRVISGRRPAQFITPIPKPKKQKGKQKGLFVQKGLILDEGFRLSTEDQEYDVTSVINEIRKHVGAWRQIPDPGKWSVTPETQRLLQHWRSDNFSRERPFFAQVEAVETAIWLTEVAPAGTVSAKSLLDRLRAASQEANPGIDRLALKLATGAGKTTVMAMLIAWQTINAVRHPLSPKFTKGFLVITPGLTIKDRLRVLQPNDPDSYYATRQLVPADMLRDLVKARIVITNYHAFKHREVMEIARGGRSLLQGRGEAIKTLETDGQLLQRVMPELLGMKGILVLNDEAHHCYREKPMPVEEAVSREEQEEVKRNREAARIWIKGIEIVATKIGLKRVLDLSATPFFLRGSGYAEGTLFPWTACDFSLMDAIECGIVKLPRVPVAENIPGSDMPLFRNLWEHIGKHMPKKRRGETDLDPLSLPMLLQTALQALYGHYEKTFDLWTKAGVMVPPCFIVVCNNTATSKLVYDFISGFHRHHEDGTSTFEQGRLEHFRNYDEYGEPTPRPRTLLIDSMQLESGEALDDKFKEIASDEIERFRREIVERTGDQRAADNIGEQELLREVMNTVGKPGRLGDSIRCVVSVSMLTEGWDANTVTHVLGVRAFGTQLLCEQVIGRALRRQSYDLADDSDLLSPEYADILGIPFDFTAKPVIAPPQPPRDTVMVQAVRPDRDKLEIKFPRVQGYRVELPEERLVANFTDDSILELTPQLVGPTQSENRGIIGEGVNLTVEHLADMRMSSIVFNLTQRLLYTKWRDAGEEPKLHLFGQLKRITNQWLSTCLVCKGGTQPAQLMYQQLADLACERITAAITQTMSGECKVKAILDPYNPEGSSRFVKRPTSKKERWQTDPLKCHVNIVVLDSDWEAEFCRAVENHPRVIAYVKNHALDFEVPYRFLGESRIYKPDFILLVDDGAGKDDPLHLVVEIKGYRLEDAKEKKATMDTYWIPGVNNNGNFGRWAFTELKDFWEMETHLAEKIEERLERIISDLLPGPNPISGRLIAQFGGLRNWEEIGARIGLTLSVNGGVIELADIHNIADACMVDTEDVLSALNLLTGGASPRLTLRLQSMNADQPAPPVEEFIRLLSKWWRKEGMSDEAWKSYASQFKVTWTGGMD